ncbi:sensor histidine kinase [Peribacillus sp. B-H-3]|uniref:sensor histidine kinase n=1 Tax=Peribacillus sp. B-H-3 TaxID=3400420 RepID=UPI003B025F0E
MLLHLRVVMFILFCWFYYDNTPPGHPWSKVYVVLVLFVLVLSHFSMFRNNRRKTRLANIYLDSSLCFGLGFVYLNSSAYLILLGIIAMTLFMSFSNARVLRIYSTLFLLFLLGEFLARFLVYGSFDVLGDILNVSFVAFGAIGGNLVRKLYDASDTLNDQYKKLDESHRALSEAHFQLKQYSDQVEELSTARERNRVAREIHDTVGHKMTALLVQLELAREFLARDVKKSEDILAICDQLARTSLEEVRYSVKTLRSDDKGEQSLILAVRSMLEDFHQAAGVKSELELKGDPSTIPDSMRPTIIRVIQESLTNAKRHGAASKSHVLIECRESEVKLMICDNGIGTAKIMPGFGLVNMKERIEEHAGTILFESLAGGGFQTEVAFPLLQKKWMIGGSA